MGKSILLQSSYWKLVLIVLMLGRTELRTSVRATQEKNCSVNRCSEAGPYIHYPFWVKTKRHNNSGELEDDCGHPPGFQLSCSQGDEFFSKDATVVEFQHLVNTSLHGLQLSLRVKAMVSSIDYKHHQITLYDPTYILNISASFLQVNSSFDSSQTYTPDYDAYSSEYPYICDNNFPLTGGNLSSSCASYVQDEYYTFFNCSSSQAVVNNDRSIVMSSLSSRGFKVYAYSTYQEPWYMMEYIRSCTKMYDISIKISRVLGWSVPVSRGRCKDVLERCKFNDHTSHSESPPSPPEEGSGIAPFKLLAAVIFPCIFMVVLGFVFLYNFIKFRRDTQKREDELKIKMFMEDYKVHKPTRYSYSDIKKITNMFKHKLGQGGYGSVFKGRISSDILVAVKVLHSDPKANGDDFINEVGTMGKIHHVNVVRLLGYCADGCNRALVYEYQPNHSLDKFVYRREEQHRFIGWKKMQKIALGIAKGIKYLHQGCAQQILHFDIKPNNILLDQNFNPKISDFGLAKLCNKGQSIVSMTAARGTIGYIAPEVFSRNFGNVSSKSDVYSFGMLLLEMVGGKNNNVEVKQNASEVYFPEWIFHRLEKGGELVIEIENEDDSKIARKLTVVGLWCIGWHPIDRPSMKVVIQMLEADECPAMPPNPFSSTGTGNGTLAKSFISEKLQVISEAE